MLKNVDLLQRMAEQDCGFDIFDVIDTLQKVDSVVSECFRNKLEPDYAKKANNFYTAYLSHGKEFIDKTTRKIQ